MRRELVVNIGSTGASPAVACMLAGRTVLATTLLAGVVRCSAPETPLGKITLDGC